MPATPARNPRTVTSPSTRTNTCRRPQPRARRTPISLRRDRTPASAASPRKRPHTTRIRANRARLSRSACCRTTSATITAVHCSETCRAGRPYDVAGRAMVTGSGDAPAVTITCSPVAVRISWPTAAIFCNCCWTEPRRSATRTRMDPMGARSRHRRRNDWDPRAPPLPRGWSAATAAAARSRPCCRRAAAVDRRGPSGLRHPRPSAAARDSWRAMILVRRRRSRRACTDRIARPRE